MHNEPDNEKQGSGVQPPDGSTERDAARYRWLRAQKTPADFYSGEPRWSVSREQGGMGQTFRNAELDAQIDEAMAAPATAGASESSGTDEPKAVVETELKRVREILLRWYDDEESYPIGRVVMDMRAALCTRADHLSEQPSVDRCVPLDRGPQFPGIYGAEPSVRMLIHSYYERNFKTAQANRYAMQYIDLLSSAAAVNQQASEPDEPKEAPYLLNEAEKVLWRMGYEAAVGESGVREALARPLPELPAGDCTIRMWPTGGLESEVTVLFTAKQMEDYAEAARSALALHSGDGI